MKDKIFLYGPPGVGKSAVGQALARDLERPFIDLDVEIESRCGKPIPEIFSEEGEAGFRLRERETLAEVLAGGPAVIALGGGALLDPQNRLQVETSGALICLNASPETLIERLRTTASERPLLTGNLLERLEELLNRRAAHYASFERALNTEGLSPQDLSWKIQVMVGHYRVKGMGAAYDVLVEEGGLQNVGERLHYLDIRGPVLVVSDENVGPLYQPGVVESLKRSRFSAGSLLIPAGEEHKTLETVSHLWEGFLAASLERGSLVAALGGGVVGDLVGFAAAAYLRGISWVVLPTSLLAMVDASLGGKTGADLPQGKNLIGAFHPPRLVLSDPLVLASLPEPELRSGLAEVVKHGVIGDPELFTLCERGWEAVSANWGEIVRRAMAVKVQIIQADPYEKGLRAALNLGHTVGHALEKASSYRLRHGEAVAVGLAVAARLSERLGLGEKGLAERIEATLQGLELPTRIPHEIDKGILFTAMRVDKKKQAGEVRFVLPLRIGEVRIGVPIDDIEALLEAESQEDPFQGVISPHRR